jgi:hypothetical protein
MTFTPAPTPKPPPDRFRNGDFWRAADGSLYAVCKPWHDATHGVLHLRCTLRPVGFGIPAHRYRSAVRGWTRVSWGGWP